MSDVTNEAFTLAINAIAQEMNKNFTVLMNSIDTLEKRLNLMEETLDEN